MVRFAHLSDVHLGSFREKELRELNLQSFEKSIDLCLEKKADFVIIAGDFFDVALPEMAVVNRAARKLREGVEKGLRFYVVYGSHDYSPTETSIIDVLCSAGLLIKISSVESSGDESPRLSLGVFKDEATGVSFAGVSARAKALEEADFAKFDYSNLQSIPHPKIFVFHSAVAELVPPSLGAMAGGVPLALLPKGFDYYATGHVHFPQVQRREELNGAPLVYPGPLSAADYRDLEDLKNSKHGFWFCELSGSEAKVERVEVNLFDVILFEHNASGKSPQAVEAELSVLLDSKELGGKVVLLKTKGVLDGDPKEANFTRIREKAAAKNPLVFLLNRNGLEAKAKTDLNVEKADANAVAESVFRESLKSVGGTLGGENGLAKSKSLLLVLGVEASPGETKTDFEVKVVSEAKKILGD